MESETKELENPNDEQTLKKGRHRKKQLYNSILQQMEFYFSDSNLTKDRFLSQLLQKDQYVELDVFLKFNKIRKLTLNVEDIKKAIKNSKLIELSDDKNSVRRKEPIKEKTNVDECTIYVERLQSDATHEWLNSVFSEFGNVVYVSVPKYRHNNVIKGFAFIEFDKEEEAEKVLSYFESIGCKMPSHAEPAELCSISTFEGNNENQQEKVPKIQNEGTETGCTNGESRKPKAESKEISDSEKSSKRKFDEIRDKNENDESSKKLKTEGEEVSESDDTENKRKKKLKKEHKKKNYIKDLGLQVLSKKEWKRMRNRYLDLQKKKMKDFKKHLYHAKYSQANYEDKQNKLTDKIEKKDGVNEKIKSYEFQEGLIIKIKLTDPITDGKKLKGEIKALSSDIMYVDVPNVGSDSIYVRFKDKEGAKEFCTQEFAGSKEILIGDEEKSYWEKMQQDREHKFEKSNNRKERGRDKLLKKAKRIKFDD